MVVIPERQSKLRNFVKMMSGHCPSLIWHKELPAGLNWLLERVNICFIGEDSQKCVRNMQTIMKLKRSMQTSIGQVNQRALSTNRKSLSYVFVQVYTWPENILSIFLINPTVLYRGWDITWGTSTRVRKFLLSQCTQCICRASQDILPQIDRCWSQFHCQSERQFWL